MGKKKNAEVVITPEKRGKPKLAKKKEFSFLSPPSAAEAWKQLAHELAIALADLDEDEFLVISDKASGYFVQFAGQGNFGMRVEAVSNQYLDEDKKLSESACEALLQLGWNAPTNLPDELESEGHKSEGSPNFFLDIAPPIPYETLGTLATKTLRKVFNVGHPGELQYSAFSDKNASIRFPHLRITRGR